MFCVKRLTGCCMGVDCRGEDESRKTTRDARPSDVNEMERRKARGMIFDASVLRSGGQEEQRLVINEQRQEESSVLKAMPKVGVAR